MIAKLLAVLLALPFVSANAATRVIVEFHGSPAALAGPGVASTHRDTLDRFRHDLRDRIAAQSLSRTAPRIRHEYSAVVFGAAVEIAASDMARLRELPYVRAIHPDREVRTYAISNEVVDARTRVNASSLPSRGKGITVAIIDTGIDYMHADLGGGLGPGFKVASGFDFVNDEDDPMDDHGHGTHVAGIAAANGPALVGVAPEATLIAYKVLNAFGAGNEATVIAAMERSVDPNGDGDFSDRHDVMNLSLGAPGTADDLMARAADAATAAGVIVVAGAGNDGRSIVSVGSPGTSRLAITVGAHDGAGAVASFSSRGPTPGLLTFKPDIVAPGVGILSAKRGGGLVGADGTSMASPHVAGVAALLRALHPEWTPADVKAALMSTALTVDATAYVRGAGRIDAQRAHDAKVLISGAGLSFGIAPSISGTFEATRTFTIENRSAADQALEVVPPAVAHGFTLTVTPATLALRPGESREVDVRLAIDNSGVPFADEEQQRLLGGTIALTGTTALTVPWGVLRSGRITIRSDDSIGYVEAFRHGAPSSTFLRGYSPMRWETFVVPGRVWDLVATSFRPDDPESLRLTFIEDRSIAGDDMITLDQADTPLRIVFESRDAGGVPFSSRPGGPLVMRNTTVSWKRESADGINDDNQYRFENLAELFVSSASARYSLSAVQTLVDLEAMDAYTVQHETLRGLTEAKTLIRDTSSMIRAELGMEPLGTSLGVCTVSGDLRLAGSSFRRGPCVTRQGRPEGVLDYFTTVNANPLLMSGIQVRTSHLTTPPFREFDGAIVAMWDATPSAAALRIQNGGTATIGSGPVFPYAIPGTTGGSTPFRPRPGFYGSLDEEQGLGAIGSPPEPAPRATYVVEREGLRAAGNVSEGVLEISYGSDEGDLEPPSLTSLRITDKAGRNVDRLTPNESATLHFSAADFDYQKAMETKVWKPEATRAWVRPAGSIDWRPLSLVSVGSETGNLNNLRHVPSGDLYRADLSTIAKGAVALYDLRIDLEDAAGNRATWTQSPAFSNGTVAAPPRRRSVR